MQLNTELDSQYYENLQQLQRTMGKDLQAVLESAIDELYARQKVAVGRDALAILKKNGFIGCMQGDGNLSQDYKQKLN